MTNETNKSAARQAAEGCTAQVEELVRQFTEGPPEDVIDLVLESHCGVSYRAGWYSNLHRPDAEAEEFAIVLAGGGPSVRVRGELDGCDSPVDVFIEYSGSEPWTRLPLTDGQRAAVLRYAQLVLTGE